MANPQPADAGEPDPLGDRDGERAHKRRNSYVPYSLLAATFCILITSSIILKNRLTLDADGRPNLLALVIVAFLALLMTPLLITVIVSLRRLERRPAPEVTFRDRITAVKSHLESSGRLLRALEDDLATRTAILEQRQEEADRYEKLASLNEAQAKAVEDLVGRQFKRQGKASAMYWWAGIVIAFVLGLVVNWISGPLWALLTR